MTNGNFRDPVGVVTRMLRSPNPAARSALLRELARVCLLPLDIVAGPIEKWRIGRSEATDAPLLLVVGAPRSGTSLLQQLLVCHLQAAFIPNGAGLLARAPMLGAKLFGGRGQRAPTDLLSYLGQTRSLRGPNDAFFLWDRSLGQARGHLGDAVDDGSLADMRRILNAWMHAYGAPLINKNNRNTVCMPSIAAALPQSKFLVVQRDPVDVAMSLLKAREEVQGDPRIGWGLLARDAAPGASQEDVLRLICEQLLEIDSIVSTAVTELGPSRVMCVDLERACSEPSGLLDDICNWMPSLKRRREHPTGPTPLVYRRHDVESASTLASVRQWLSPITSRGPA